MKRQRDAHLHTEIQRSDSIFVGHVFGTSREQDLCCVSLSVAAEQRPHIAVKQRHFGEYYTLTGELITIMTTPAGEVKRRGSRDVWPVDVSSTVQKTQHRLKGK